MPTFGGARRLARYIEPQFRKGANRAKPPAFMEDPDSTKDGLSVNSLEIHTENQIASIYAEKFAEERPVALSIHSIDDYNQAALEAGLQVQGWHDQEPHWTHQGPGGAEASYVHHPRDGNDSHCLVRYTRDLDENAEFRFARRLAHKPRFRTF